jgi:hypothetical protein
LAFEGLEPIIHIPPDLIFVATLRTFLEGIENTVTSVTAMDVDGLTVQNEMSNVVTQSAEKSLTVPLMIVT